MDKMRHSELLSPIADTLDDLETEIKMLREDREDYAKKLELERRANKEALLVIGQIAGMLRQQAPDERISRREMSLRYAQAGRLSRMYLAVVSKKEKTSTEPQE